MLGSCELHTRSGSNFTLHKIYFSEGPACVIEGLCAKIMHVGSCVIGQVGQDVWRFGVIVCVGVLCNLLEI